MVSRRVLLAALASVLAATGGLCGTGPDRATAAPARPAAATDAAPAAAFPSLSR